MSTSDSKKITLKSSDEEIFEVDEAVALQCQMIKYIIEDDCANDAIPLPNVTSKILAKVIEYCKKHAEYNNNNNNNYTTCVDDQELKNWDANFSKDVFKDDQKTFFDLILAANYLDIKGLMDLTCDTVAEVIKGAETPEGIRKTFHIKNDYTPEEEEEVHRKNKWAFE